MPETVADGERKLVMETLVSYRRNDSIAMITMDDGKVNVLSPRLLAELNLALDQAAADRAVVVLTGRPGVFSAGFDLAVLRAGGPAGAAMLRAGFELAERVLSFPAPVLVACTGHAIAMGAFLLLSADYRVGADGPYKFTANEVAIGLTIPQAAIEICRQRLTPAHLTRTILLAEVFTPQNAVAVGFLDQVVPPDDLAAVANSTAARLAALDLDAHATSKLRARAQTLRAIRAAIEADFAAVPA
jgi:enoyl-CoA hydratase